MNFNDAIKAMRADTRKVAHRNSGPMEQGSIIHGVKVSEHDRVFMVYKDLDDAFPRWKGKMPLQFSARDYAAGDWIVEVPK